jgi:hypothetical protein
VDGCFPGIVSVAAKKDKRPSLKTRITTHSRKPSNRLAPPGPSHFSTSAPSCARSDDNTTCSPSW